MAQGIGKSGNQGSTLQLPGTAGNKCFLVSCFLWASLSSLRHHRNYSLVGCHIDCYAEVLQDIISGRSTYAALSAVGEFCGGIEYINMGIESIRI